VVRETDPIDLNRVIFDPVYRRSVIERLNDAGPDDVGPDEGRAELEEHSAAGASPQQNGPALSSSPDASEGGPKPAVRQG
jgi:hypothetical protein